MDEYIYISIPKTGSNSIHKIFGHSQFNHKTANTIKKKIGDLNYNQRISFCFIRNPIDLVKSWYYYHKYSPNVIRSEVKQFYPDTIEEWVFDMKCKTHWEGNDHRIQNPDWDLSNPLYQTNWIKDTTGSVIVDKVFAFDDIEHHIFDMFNQSITIENKSNKDDYILRPETENKIAAMFSEDIMFYNSLQKRHKQKD